MKLFYLDDDIEELELFLEAVDEINPSIECVAYTDSKQALQEISTSTDFDLIFLDYNMPILTGEECLGKIRQMEHLQHVPVIIYSTGVDEKVKQRLLANGAALVIKKHQTCAELKKFLMSNALSSQSKH